MTVLFIRLLLSIGLVTYFSLQNGTFNIFFVSNTSYIGFIVFFSVYLHYRRPRFRRFFREALNLLPKHQLEFMSALSKQNCWLFLVYLMANLLCGIPLTAGSERWKYVLLQVFMRENNFTNRLIAGTLYAYEIVTLTMWIVVAFCLYNWAHVIKHRLCMCLLDTIQAILIKGDTLTALEKATEVIKLMRIVQSKFDQSFSLIAFLIFSCNFFQAPGYLIGQFTIGAGSDLVSKLQTIGFSFLYLSVALILVTTVNTRHNELMDRVGELMDELAKCGNQHASLIATRIETCVSKETAWGIFTIDKSLIGTYAGHLLTFSVMFFQMIPTGKAT